MNVWGVGSVMGVSPVCFLWLLVGVVSHPSLREGGVKPTEGVGEPPQGWEGSESSWWIRLFVPALNSATQSSVPTVTSMEKGWDSETRTAHYGKAHYG